jgi:hypothetical protein
VTKQDTKIDRELWERGWSKLRGPSTGEQYVWQAPSGESFVDLNAAIAAIREDADDPDLLDEGRAA